MKPDRESRKKHWVRLTRLCNNRCVFCLDSDEQNGTIISTREILVELEKGLRAGANQVVLSGGEPTLHPNFIEIVSLARKAGYSWIQTISNGRMFSYRGFLEKAAAAGLNEITFSLHDIEPESLDKMTRTPGGFEEAMAGLMRALKENRLAVSVDIALNRMNAGRLCEIVTKLAALGVRDFDILYPIPFGEAWHNKDLVFFDISKFTNDIREAVNFCRENGLFLSTNRMPPFALEGAEEAIQMPIKLHGEVGDRREVFDNLASKGIKPGCMGERCGFCFMNRFCETLSSFNARIHSGAPFTVLLRPECAALLSEPLAFAVQDVIIDPAELFDSASVVEFLSKNKAGVSLVFTDLKNEPHVDLGKAEAVYVELNSKTVPILIEHGPSCLPTREAKLLLRNQLTLESTLTQEVCISDFVRDFKSKWGEPPDIANVPPCITGAKHYTACHGVPLDIFDCGQGVNLDRFIDHYIEAEMNFKSLRCEGCAMYSECPGLHINQIRAFGFSMISRKP